MHVLNKLNKEKCWFYLLLCILITNRLIASINSTTNPTDHVFEPAVCIARGIAPYTQFFRQDCLSEGWGPYIFSILSVPFIWLCGESYFSLMLLRIIIRIFIYILIWKFSLRYFSLRVALFAALMFVFLPVKLTYSGVLPFGRYFELNFFFLASLFLLCKCVEKKQMRYYLLLGVLCGVGVSFYPAFLSTSAVICLFLWATIKHKWTLFGFAHVWFIICIMIATEYLETWTSWHDWQVMFRQLLATTGLFSDAGEMSLLDYLYRIMHRLYALIANIPDLFNPYPIWRYNDIDLITGTSRIIFSILFYSAIITLIWINRQILKNVMVSICSLTKKCDLSPKECAISFVLIHFILYIIVYSTTGGPTIPCSYHLIVILNIILIITLFLDTIWQVSKKGAVCLFMCALLPGMIFHGYLYTQSNLNNLYLQYLCFYRDEYFIENIDSHKSTLKAMCDRCPLTCCHTVGKILSHEELCIPRYPHDTPINNDNYFNFLAKGNKEKLAQLYQGYIMQYYLYTQGDMNKTISKIKSFDTRYWQYCFRGLGEGITTFEDLHHEPQGYWFWNPEAMKDSIEGKIVLIPDNCKGYFYQGIGTGIAKQFAVPCGIYITEYGFYDNDIFNQYLIHIEKKYRKDFMKGFSLVQNWNKL